MISRHPLPCRFAGGPNEEQIAGGQSLCWRSRIFDSPQVCWRKKPGLLGHASFARQTAFFPTPAFLRTMRSSIAFGTVRNSCIHTGGSDKETVAIRPCPSKSLPPKWGRWRQRITPARRKKPSVWISPVSVVAKPSSSALVQFRTDRIRAGSFSTRKLYRRRRNFINHRTVGANEFLSRSNFSLMQNSRASLHLSSQW